MSAVRLSVTRHVAELRLDNPARLNAFTADMLAELAAHCDEIERRNDLRGVLVAADGTRAF